MRMNFALGALLTLATAAAAAAAAEGDQPPAAGPVPSVAEQKPGSWVRRVAARPMEDVGLLPRISYESSLAYDRRNKVAVMWGGHGLQCDSPQLDETWLYDPAANAWRESASPRRPMGSCCVRDSAYDEVAGRVVQFEGHHGSHGWEFTRHKGWGLRASTPWLFDAAADRWTPMRPAFGPGNRPYKALAYSPDHFISLMFSGEGQKNDTWAYDSYTNTWFEMNPPEKPPAFLGGGMCYDRRRKVFVMLAAAMPAVGKPGSPHGLWTFDPAAGLWKEQRPEHSPAAGSNALVVYDDAAAQALCFAAVEAAERGKWRMQVWALDLEKPDWTDVTPPGPGPAYYNQCVCYVPELNVHVIGPGHTNWETGHPTVRETWTYRYKEGKAPEGMLANSSLNVTTDEKAVVVRYGERAGGGRDPVSPLFRAEGEQPWKLAWTEIAPDMRVPDHEKVTSFRDEKVERGKVYWYRLKVGDQFTTPLRAQPAVPACPLVILKNEKETEIVWAASPEKDLAGYNVYRSRVRVLAAGGGQVSRLGGAETFVKLNAEPSAEPKFGDKTVDLSVPDAGGAKLSVYAYHVRAVNKLGVESGPSPFALTIPEGMDAPQIAKAEAGKVTLKWPKHPSPSVVGYNLYRITATYEKFKKVNTEVIKAVEFTDESLPGDGMRRYCVLAVDAFGQEGISSPEVWAFRKPTAHPLPD
jgi:hypothetical protein